MEKEFMGARKSKMWTYLIMLGLLVVGALVANLVLSNPEVARTGIDRVVGLPSWGLTLITFALGAGIFWVGLKMETDWPEAFGALLMAGAVTLGEILIGWNHFQLAGMVVVPYLLPIALFLGLLAYGMTRSQ